MTSFPSLRPDLENALSARALRKDGPLLDVTLSAPGMRPVTGKALIDTGADRTAVEFTAVEDATPKGSYFAQGVTSEAIALPVYELELAFPNSALPPVKIENAAATPHLRSQGLIALLGRDVLEQARLTYHGPSGEFELATPKGEMTVRSPGVAVGIVGAMAALGAALAYVVLRTPDCPPCAAAAGAEPIGGGRMTSFDIRKYALHFVNNFPDATYAGIHFNGLCGGMVYTTLDYWTAARPSPDMTATPSTMTPLGAYVQGRQADSLLGADGARFLALLATPGDLASTSSAEFQNLRTSIDRDAPVVLGLIPSWGTNPTQAHQVLATGYAENEQGRIVYIWDPNRPNDPNVTLLQATGTSPWVEAATKDSWRGFFVGTSYMPKDPPAMTPAALPVA